MTLNLASDALALCESLRTSLYESNRLGGYFAQEVGGAFGDIKNALVTTLACAIADWTSIYFGDARDIANRLFREAVDNGESIAYQIDLWNRGLLS